jgi:hypothetical protein
LIGGHLLFEKTLSDETVLWAKITRRDDGRPHVHELTIRHPTSEALRQGDISELENEVTLTIDELRAVGREFVLAVCGIDPRQTVVRRRGPRPKWTDENLSALVDVVLARQASGEKATDVPGYAENRVRELMRRAKRSGLVVIEQVNGANVYRRP